MNKIAILKGAVDAISRHQERDLYEESLMEFAEYVWPVVEPAIPFVRGWAIEAIADHLQAVTDGYIRRLLINVPPGFTKPVRKDTIIQTLRGNIPISEAVIGDMVLTHKGRFRAILGVHRQGILPILKISTWCGREVYAAHDHPFLTTRGWIKANRLTTSDILAAVAPKEESGIRTSPYEARFLGYMVGDGSTKYAAISFTNMEVDVLRDFSMCSDALGFTSRIATKPGNRASTVYLSSNRDGSLQRFLKRHDLAGKGSYSKRIPAAIMMGDNISASNFLGAYWSCDGYVAIRHKGKKTSYLAKLTTVGKELAKDIQCLALKLGINLRIRKRVANLQSKRQGGKYVSYDLEATNQNEVAKIARLFGLCERKYNLIREAIPRSFENCLLPDPVESIVEDEAAECMCLTVEEDESFAANGIAVHNSLMTDVFWPSWIWGPRNKPHMRFMCAAYSNYLTERDNMRCRNIVISDRYKRLWGNRFKISNEQFTKIKFANDKTGWKLATSVGGVVTGERADVVIIDDPNNPMEMESEAIRSNTNMWFTEVIPDRLNNQAESAIVVIQQRTHEDDVSGVAMAKEMGYVHLCIPMKYVPCQHINGYVINEEEKTEIKTVTGEDNVSQFPEDNIFWIDKRQKEDELAWPERFPDRIVKELERDKGQFAFAGQYMQDPEPRGGSIIKYHFWQKWEDPKFPDFEFILASLDTAYTSKEENDASALTIWGVFREDNALQDVEAKQTGMLWMKREGQVLVPNEGNPKIMLMYAWQERLEFHDLLQRVINTCTISADPCPHPRYRVDRLLVEAKASGASVGQELVRLLRGTGKLGVELITPKQSMDKVARVQSIQHLFADNMIYAPDRNWADMVIKQCAVFPKGSHDDLVDSTSQALRYLRDAGFAMRREEFAMEAEEEMRYKSPMKPLYEV